MFDSIQVDTHPQGNIIVEDSDSESPEGDTDVEESGPGVTAAAAALPARLAGCTLVLDAALAAPLDAQLLARYCIAYGGLVLKVTTHRLDILARVDQLHKLEAPRI